MDDEAGERMRDMGRDTGRDMEREIGREIGCERASHQQPEMGARPWRLWLAGLVTLAVLAANALIFAHNTQTLVDRDQLVTRTQSVLTTLNGTLALVTDAETGQRGYILTGQLPYLQPYQDAVHQIPSQLARLAQVVADNPVQVQRLPQLRSLIAAKMAELAQTVALRRSGQTARALQIVLSNQGSVLMDHIRALLARMTQTALTRLTQRTARAQAAQNTATVTLLVATGGAMALLLLLLVVASHTLRRHAQVLVLHRQMLTQEQMLRAQAETTVRLRENLLGLAGRFRTLVDEAPVAIALTDAAGRYQTVNRAFGTLSGYTADELIGQPPTLLFPDAPQALPPGEGAPGVSAGPTAPTAGQEAELRTKEGQVRSVLMSRALLADGASQPVQATFIIDVTERTQAAQEVIRALSTPVLHLRERLLLLPLIGPLDAQRGTQVTERLLGAIRETRAKVVVLDITGVPLIDTITASQLTRAVEAARLLGAVIIITGLSAEIARRLVRLGVDLSALDTRNDLQAGIAEAEQLLDEPRMRRTSVAGLGR